MMAVATGFVCVVSRGGGSGGGLALQRPTQLYICWKRNNSRSCCITDCPRRQGLTRPGGKSRPPLSFKPLAPRLPDNSTAGSVRDYAAPRLCREGAPIDIQRHCLCSGGNFLSGSSGSSRSPPRARFCKRANSFGIKRTSSTPFPLRCCPMARRARIKIRSISANGFAGIDTPSQDRCWVRPSSPRTVSRSNHARLPSQDRFGPDDIRVARSHSFQRKVLLDVLELPATVRQTSEIYGRDLLLSVDGRRVRHFHRRPQSRVSLLQQIVQVLARMLATTLVERNPATFLIPDHYPARVRTLTFAFFPILVLLKTRKNLHSRIIDLKQLPIRRQFPQMAIDGQRRLGHFFTTLKLHRLRQWHAASLLQSGLPVKRHPGAILQQGDCHIGGWIELPIFSNANGQRGADPLITATTAQH